MPPLSLHVPLLFSPCPPLLAVHAKSALRHRAGLSTDHIGRVEMAALFTTHGDEELFSIQHCVDQMKAKSLLGTDGAGLIWRSLLLQSTSLSTFPVREALAILRTHPENLAHLLFRCIEQLYLFIVILKATPVERLPSLQQHHSLLVNALAVIQHYTPLLGEMWFKENQSMLNALFFSNRTLAEVGHIKYLEIAGEKMSSTLGFVLMWTLSILLHTPGFSCAAGGGDTPHPEYLAPATFKGAVPDSYSLAASPTAASNRTAVLLALVATMYCDIGSQKPPTLSRLFTSNEVKLLHRTATLHSLLNTVLGFNRSPSSVSAWIPFLSKSEKPAMLHFASLLALNTLLPYNALIKEDGVAVESVTELAHKQWRDFSDIEHDMGADARRLVQRVLHELRAGLDHATRYIPAGGQASPEPAEAALMLSLVTKVAIANPALAAEAVADFSCKRTLEAALYHVWQAVRHGPDGAHLLQEALCLLLYLSCDPLFVGDLTATADPSTIPHIMDTKE
eukprot:Sspe_Gene.49689::Locus_26992_Transcript_1_1_Confidence_1.000_Length_1774::g.49689::m.49689